MPTLLTTVDGLRLPNPFVIASGPPGTNLNVIQRAFREGWGAVIAKTVSLDASKVINVTPRYGKLHAADKREIVGWENIELISDRPIEIWLEEFRRCKDQNPDGVLIASVMEEYSRDAWFEIIERCEHAGVDGFELNFSCPHGLPERKMGSAMGEDPEILLEANSVQVCTGVMKFGYELIRPLCEELLAFMDKHDFESLDDFRGHSLEYFTTHAELVRIQKERKAAPRVSEQGRFIKADGDWSGDRFVEQTSALSR